MATFVLIHGAWHGGWCWKRVAPALRRAGHEVYAPSLTGLGERRHLAARDIDLDTHIQDVLALLEMEGLREVVLLGHSYGGMVVTGAADRAPERISHLIYLDAFVPEDGKCLLDYVVAERGARMREEGERTGFVAPPPMALWGLTQPEDLEFVGAREVRHPYRTMKQAVSLSGQRAAAAIPRSFVYCSSPATGSFDQFAAKYRNDPGWRFYQLETGHDAMLLMPQAVTRILLEHTAPS